jgi:hypothetical protein
MDGAVKLCDHSIVAWTGFIWNQVSCGILSSGWVGGTCASISLNGSTWNDDNGGCWLLSLAVSSWAISAVGW